MYDELKERCRACSQGCIYPSECSYFNKPPLRCMRQLLSEAADAIEVLSKKENTTRWIPVTERLPKEQETVLTWGEQGIILLNWRHDNKWCGCLGDVTHWMPLPQPPKEGMRMSFPTLKDGSRNWCATCKHNDGDLCEFGEECMYRQNADGTYNHDLPPTEYEEE